MQFVVLAKSESDREQGRIQPLDYLLIIGTVVAPMTGLRIGQVGPGEVLVFAWCGLSSLGQSESSPPASKQRSPITLGFWIAFLTSIVVGALIGFNKVPDQVYVSQISTWFFLGFITIAAYRVLIYRHELQVRRIFVRIAQLTSLWYSALYLYSLVISSTFFGAPLWYGGARFSGGGTNPHQVSLLLGVAVVILLWSIQALPQRRRSILSNLILAGVALFLCVETGSATLYMSLVLSLLATILVVVILSKLTGAARVLAILAIFLTTILSFSKLLTIAKNFVESDPNGPGRIDIWSDLPEVLALSPLVGLGPGTHSWGGTAEFHNTYIEVLAMSGIVGLSLFMGYHIYVLCSLKYAPTLLPVITLIMTYGFAGFSARRLPYWIVLVLVLVISQKAAHTRENLV